MLDNEQLKGIAIEVYGADYWNVKIDRGSLSNHWQQHEIAIENEKLRCYVGSLLCFVLMSA